MKFSVLRMQNICEYGLWAVNTDLEGLTVAFGSKCLRKIIRYRWNDRVSQELLRETESKLTHQHSLSTPTQVLIQ